MNRYKHVTERVFKRQQCWRRCLSTLARDENNRQYQACYGGKLRWHGTGRVGVARGGTTGLSNAIPVSTSAPREVASARNLIDRWRQARSRPCGANRGVAEPRYTYASGVMTIPASIRMAALVAVKPLLKTPNESDAACPSMLMHTFRTSTVFDTCIFWTRTDCRPPHCPTKTAMVGRVLGRRSDASVAGDVAHTIFSHA